MIITRYKAVLTAGALAFTGLMSAQSMQEGINAVDSQKFEKARQIYSNMAASDKDGDAYFFIGNTYLTQFEPDYEAARAEFQKGLAKNAKSHLNRIGLASIKLAKGDKSGISEIQAVVKDSREKDPEVLYRAAEALTLNEKAASPDLAIEYLNKAIEKSKSAPAHYYYTMGDAYWLKKDAGKAMTAYESALPVAKNKASVYTRMAKLWILAKQWKLAQEKINQAIAADPTYAPIYRLKADYDIIYQDYKAAAQDLLNYEKYADRDPVTQLEIVKLYFNTDDYKTAQSRLNSVFDSVNDPIKYKLRAYLKFINDSDYTGAKADLDQFYKVADPSKIFTADRGLEGLILAGLAKDTTDSAQKKIMMDRSAQLIAAAKKADDKTLDWDAQLARVSGAKVDIAAANAGPTSAKIAQYKATLEKNPNDTNTMVEMATEYQNLGNWNAALVTWQKISSLAPTWSYAYFGQALALAQLERMDDAKSAFQLFVNKAEAAKPEEQMQLKDSIAYAYYYLAYLTYKDDKATALQYLDKCLTLKPNDQDAQKLKEVLMK